MRKICYLIVLFFFAGCFISYGAGKKGFPVHHGTEVGKNTRTTLFDKPLQAHPRLLFSVQEEKNLKKLENKDPFLKEMLGLLKVKADELLATPLMEFKLRTEYSDLLMSSREHLYRMITLSLAYRMFGDIRYAKKAEENLANVCNYPNWDPKHFLDVAEMTEAVAIGYDWLYPVLSDNTKKLVIKAIKEKALDYAAKEYVVGDSTSWAKRGTNWNVVCNTGMVMGSLAIAESDPKLTERIVTQAVSFVPNCVKYYAPDGVWYEGPGYWDYTSTNLAMLLQSLDYNLGHDYGLSKMPGVGKTASYYVSSLSPTGRIFNFADAGFSTSTLSPVYFYYSKRFNYPQVAEYYRSLLSQTMKEGGNFPRWHFFLCIPWYDNAKSVKVEKPKLQIFENEFNPILVFNGKSTSKNSIYLIAKGGAGDEAHQHLDLGSFIVETNGIRWADELGAERYSLPGFWDYTPVTGQRWKYFRDTNFSHNTLSIDGQLQLSDGRGKILRYDKDSEKPFGIIDMSTAYKGLASKVQRGFRLLADNVVLVQDEINLTSGAKQIEWNSITGADVTVDGNTAVLQKSGQKMYFKIISPANATFFAAIPKTYTADEYPISGYTLLKINVSPEDGTDQTIRVVMSCDANAINDTNLIGTLQPLSKW